MADDFCVLPTRRRIQSIGGSSYSITLPPDWVAAMGLTKTDELLITPQNGSLLITIASRKKTETDGPQSMSPAIRVIVDALRRAADDIDAATLALEAQT